MIAFDYLRGERATVLLRIIECRVPQRLHSSATALAIAVVVALGAWGIESYRLSSALAIQGLYETQFAGSERAVAQTRVRYRRLQERAALDRRIREIRTSGFLDAERLAEIANRLPAHMWLTSITRDSGGMLLEGSARSLASLSLAIDGLSRSTRLRNAVLVSATSEEESGSGRRQLKYQLHVDGDR